MRKTTRLLLIPLVPLVAACGADAGGSGASAGIAGGATHPCDAFTVADVASQFSVAEGLIVAERGEPVANVTCSYEWARPDSAAIAERNREIVLAALAPGGGGLDALKTQEPTQTELLITFNDTDFGNAAEAVQGLDTMVERLEKGITASAGEATATFSSSFDPSTGVGDKAVWSSGLRQLSVASGARLFHVRLHANNDPAIDRPVAEEVGRKIAAARGR